MLSSLQVVALSNEKLLGLNPVSYKLIPSFIAYLSMHSSSKFGGYFGCSIQLFFIYSRFAEVLCWL